MIVLNNRYELRVGEPSEIQAPRETVDFMTRAASRRLEIAGQPAEGLAVSPNPAGDRIVIAPTAKAKPGTYRVTLAGTSASGEERQTALDIVVKPRVSVPNNSPRPPVVLLNGWQSGFTGACSIATSSSQTFGNLAQYLVADGVPVVYLFDNCLEDPNATIEVLGNDLADFLQTIKYDDGTQVPQIDLIGYSMGGVIARSYLVGLQPNQTYLPPASTLVRKLVLIATPNFGSFVASNYTNAIPAGTQSAELIPGSSLLWNLASWNQHGDDLRGADAIAIVGNAGTYTPSLSSSSALTNASDGLVSLTSASIGFQSRTAADTRIVPYCHLDPSAYTNPNWGTFACNAAGIANITSESHPASQIIRSFLAGTTAWQSIGTIPTADSYLSKNGALFFALQGTNAAYLTDLSQVTWGTIQFQNGANAGEIFFSDFLAGTGLFTATSSSLGKLNCGTLAAELGYTAAARCKLGAAIISVTPVSSSGPGRSVVAGTSITVNGANFGSQCNGCQVTITPAGSSTATLLTITSWGVSVIAAKLPANVTGLVTLRVSALAGVDTVGVMVVGASSIAASPASLQFAYTSGNADPAAQAIQITNAGTGTLAWTATANQPWINLTSTSGSAPSTLSVSVSPSALAAGSYSGTVTLAASGASNSPVTIAVTLAVTALPATLTVTPQSLSFQYTAGAAAPAAQQITIAGTVAWTAASNAFWAAISEASGTAPSTPSISVNPANLAAGTYHAVVTITPADSTLAALPVAITLVVQGTQAAGSVTAVVNAGSYQPGVASGTWITIFGAGLSQRTYLAQAGDLANGALPTNLQGVSVTIDGLSAQVDYISPTQVNVLAPDDATLGPVKVVVTTAGQVSNEITVQKTQFSPAFLTQDGKAVAALHADYSTLNASSPAKPGETILLYAVGFGPGNPLTNPVQVTIGGLPAAVVFAGVVQPGLDQFNVTVPAVPDGDATLSASVGGVATQTGVTVAVKQ